MRKLLDRWWIFVCGGITIFLLGLFIMNDLGMRMDERGNAKKYMKKIGDNVHPMLENIKIHADGNEYEVIIINSYFVNKHFDTDPFRLKTYLFQGRVDLNYYILKKGSEPLDEDYGHWCLTTTIPVKRDSIFGEYHIDGKLVSEVVWYNHVFHSVIYEFLDDYISNKNIEIIKEYRSKAMEKEDFEHENTLVFNNDGELKEEGKILISFITSDKVGKIKVTAKFEIKSTLGEKNLYITTERM
ncbi:hypothetical protein [Oceanirhabdus seepicola]|uniref:Uncharacterized protein n=1 Tax=Oceanirhabdus seepicola TaxID=2828781 RepID=A0A9J6NZW1_9CLOT|nr:hypothetical protein [Oceanirhabdus seepicola]MCM1989149.1 hypothetical protein [Oceanirhabdus seepicola]